MNQQPNHIAAKVWRLKLHLQRFPELKAKRIQLRKLLLPQFL
ncbi:hypothetical protein [Myxosarcina sp. GI1]|nr:hypothetical protein [Myxosarcina sp. GI1]